MDTSKIIEKTHNLLYTNLLLKSPVLSGSMKMHIQDNGERGIVIDAPFYDLKEWNKTGNIVYTGKVYNGVSAYASIVNEMGAFGKHNKSEGWVNRAILEVANVIANEIGAEVVYEL